MLSKPRGLPSWTLPDSAAAAAAAPKTLLAGTHLGTGRASTSPQQTAALRHAASISSTRRQQEQQREQEQEQEQLQHPATAVLETWLLGHYLNIKFYFPSVLQA